MFLGHSVHFVPNNNMDKESVLLFQGPSTSMNGFQCVIKCITFTLRSDKRLILKS